MGKRARCGCLSRSPVLSPLVPPPFLPSPRGASSLLLPHLLRRVQQDPSGRSGVTRSSLPRRSSEMRGRFRFRFRCVPVLRACWPRHVRRMVGVHCTIASRPLTSLPVSISFSLCGISPSCRDGTRPFAALTDWAGFELVYTSSLEGLIALLLSHPLTVSDFFSRLCCFLSIFGLIFSHATQLLPPLLLNAAVNNTVFLLSNYSRKRGPLRAS